MKALLFLTGYVLFGYALFLALTGLPQFVRDVRDRRGF